jgi:hypothetical protein
MVTETLAPAPSLRHFTFYDPAPSTYRKVKLRYRPQGLLPAQSKSRLEAKLCEINRK